MEITKTQKDLIEKVTERYKPYIQALRTPDLKSQTPIDNYKAIYNAIIIACEYTGAAKTEENGATRFLAENLLKELLSKFPFIRHGEIELALKKGALKEYGEYFGINMQTLYGWVKKYLGSQELIAAKREWVDLIEVPRSDVPVAKIFELTNEQIKSLFNDYKSGEPLPIYARIYYDELCKKKNVKTLVNSDSVRSEIRTNARIEYEKGLKAKNYHTNDPANFKLLMEQFTASNKTYQGISKRLALQSYFSELIKDGKDLEL